MTMKDANPRCLHLFASFLAGRTLQVSEAPVADAAYTDGSRIYVSANRTLAQQRQETLLQSALLGAGSLTPELMKSLRGRPLETRRYLALEGHRVLLELAGQIALAAKLYPPGNPATSTPAESLQLAKGRTAIADPPDWFGMIRPSQLLTQPESPGTRANKRDLQLAFEPTDVPEADEDAEGEAGKPSKILSLFENPLFNSQSLSDYFRKLFGTSRSPGENAAGAEFQARALRRASKPGTNARPLPTPIRFSHTRAPSTTAGISGALYPEWDVHNNQYRKDWCRVLDFPLDAAPDVMATGMQRDEVLRQRLSRVGLGPKVLRRRPDGEDLDVEALLDLAVDLKAGYSPPENIYLQRRKLARNLGVLILLDSSGSATDADSTGKSVHDHQRHAATTIAATLEELGDRVAVYGFRSHGRHQVHLLELKTFAQRFSAGGRARLNQLESNGYTRLGAGIRGAGELLRKESGTPNRLLLVLSDGHAYDDGYEHRYAEADTHKALEELRADGIACLCLSIGAATTAAALHPVFGAAHFAAAPRLADLSGRMDELFLAALQELAAPNSQCRRPPVTRHLT